MIESAIQGKQQPAGRRMDDSPLQLRNLTDIEKGDAISAGIERLVGAPIAANVDSVSYRVIGRLTEFKYPAEIRLTVSPLEGDDWSGVKTVADSELENAIAHSLAKAAGEEYQVKIMHKNYVRRGAGPQCIRLGVQVARCNMQARNEDASDQRVLC